MSVASCQLASCCGETVVWRSVAHAISCYAPTFARPRHEKEKCELRDCLLFIPEHDLYVVLGDFNARVGSSPGHEEDEWRQVRGPYGVGTMNEAGEELLSFFHVQLSTL